MKIPYAEKQTWRKETVELPETLYSRKNVKRIRSTIAKLEENAISYEFKKLSVDFLDSFTPLYRDLIGKKRNANLHDLYEKTLNNPNSSYEYLSLGITMGRTALGGAILLSSSDIFMIAYRAFLPKWPHGSLQASPSLLADYLIAQTAYKLGKKHISHGKDRNLYGLNSEIGQLTYKLSVGYAPKLPIATNESSIKLNIDISTIKSDCVILQYPDTGNDIHRAMLITSHENEKEYSQLLNYPERLKVDVFYRD